MRRLAFLMAAAGGLAAAAAALAEGEPSPWPQTLSVGGDYADTFADADPTFSDGSRSYHYKCAVIATEAGQAYDLIVRRARDNPNKNIFSTGPFVQVGTGTCDDLTVGVTGWYDPGEIGTLNRLRFTSAGGDYIVRVFSRRSDYTRDSFTLGVRPGKPGLLSAKLQPGSAAAMARSAAPAPAPAPVGPQAVFAQLCNPASATLSPATCAAMKADLDHARAAELKATYAELCGPGAAGASAETCAALKAEAAVEGRRASPQPSARPKTGGKRK